MEFLRIDDFKFRDKFIDLTDAQLSNALQIINAQFSGVYTLWGFLSPGDAQAKRELSPCSCLFPYTFRSFCKVCIFW